MNFLYFPRLALVATLVAMVLAVASAFDAAAKLEAMGVVKNLGGEAGPLRIPGLGPSCYIRGIRADQPVLSYRQLPVPGIRQGHRHGAEAGPLGQYWCRRTEQSLIPVRACSGEVETACLCATMIYMTMTDAMHL